jgi:MFS family permease
MARDATRGAWPLFVALSFLMVGNGLQSSWWACAPTWRVSRRRHGRRDDRVLRRLPRRRLRRTAHRGGTVGHVRVYSGLASLGSIALLVYTLFTSPGLWFGMRVVTGFCLAGLYIVAESWLNTVVSNDNRGRVLSSTWWWSVGAWPPDSYC